MKIRDIIADVLYEAKEQSLYIFYKISIFLQNFPKPEEMEQQQVIQQPVPPPEQPPAEQLPVGQSPMPLQQSADVLKVG